MRMDSSFCADGKCIPKGTEEKCRWTPRSVQTANASLRALINEAGIDLGFWQHIGKTAL